jgi:hypothetical protein
MQLGRSVPKSPNLDPWRRRPENGLCTSGRTCRIRTCDQRIKRTVRAQCAEPFPSVRQAHGPHGWAVFAPFLPKSPNLAHPSDGKACLPLEDGAERGKLRQNLYCRSFALLMTARSQSNPLRSIFSHRAGGRRTDFCTKRSSGGFGGRPILPLVGSFIWRLL